MVTTARTFFSIVDVSYMPQLAVSVELRWVIWKMPCEAEMMLATRLPLLLAKRSARSLAFSAAPSSRSSFKSSSLVK